MAKRFTAILTALIMTIGLCSFGATTALADNRYAPVSSFLTETEAEETVEDSTAAPQETTAAAAQETAEDGSAEEKTETAGTAAAGSGTGTTAEEKTEAEPEETLPATGIPAAADVFTEDELDAEYDEDSPEIEFGRRKVKSDSDEVDISGNTVQINGEGTYILSGSCENGQIVIDAQEGTVQLVLDGLDLSCEGSAALYVKNAENVVVTLAEGSENSLVSLGEFEPAESAEDVEVEKESDDINAAVFSNCGLCINGSGSLTISSETGSGVDVRGDLKFAGGDVKIEAADKGFCGSDSVAIAGGSLEISCGNKGVDAPAVFILGGELAVRATGDDSGNAPGDGFPGFGDGEFDPEAFEEYFGEYFEEYFGDYFADYFGEYFNEFEDYYGEYYDDYFGDYYDDFDDEDYDWFDDFFGFFGYDAEGGAKT